MGKRDKKTAKGRLDKYYHLAKEQGYRARSAFKLIQINKKYGFLESAKCAIDLCAAPGGWLQVCSKTMQRNSLILGVDLSAIKPIPGVLTAVEDITTPSCRSWLRQHMHDWKADVVLHDGAPNVGTAWVQDAFAQAELTLHSLKLATEFLNAGGTFVTKVFRSKDYNSLLWVLKQLFRRVEATKPPSSRNVSAEIFLVCSSYLAPKHIDPKLLSAQHVFKDLSVINSTEPGDESKTKNITTNKKLTAEATRVFHPEIAEKRRRREGYGEGEETPAVLWSKATIKEFVETNDPVGLLSRVGELEWSEDSSEFKRKNKVDLEVQELVKDLKVLGKKDFKTLLKWRAALRVEYLKENKGGVNEETIATIETLPQRTEEEEAQEELDRLDGEALAAKRRERRRTNERKAKDVRRMQLGMATPMDIALEDQQGLEMFGLDMSDGEMSESGEDEQKNEDEDDLDSDAEEERKVGRLEDELDGMFKAFQEKRLEKDVKGKTERRRKERMKRAQEEGGEWTGIQDSDDDVMSGNSDEDIMMESKSGGEDLGSSDDEREEESTGMQVRGKKRGRDGKLIVRFEKKGDTDPVKRKDNEVKMWFDQATFKDVEGLEDLIIDNVKDDSTTRMDDEDEEEDEEEDEDDEEREEGEDVMGEMEDELDNQETRKKRRVEELGLITAEAMTLARKLGSHEKTASQLIDDGFNRNAFNDKEGLPSWFLEDEDKVFRSNIPVTKEAVQIIRDKMRALNARPIKKVAEAKARKKMRTARRVDKLRQKAIGIEEGAGDLTEREKQGEIEKIMKKMGSVGKLKKGKDGKAQKNSVKVVVAKGVNKGQGRPTGVKGRYKMVDPRLKKDARALKRISKENKKRGGKATKAGHKLRN